MAMVQREWLASSPTMWFAGPALVGVVVALGVAVQAQGAPWWPVGVAAALVLVLASSHLTVRRESGHVVLVYWPFARRKVALADVVRAQAVTYRPMRDYGGWGIKWGWSRAARRGVAWSVAGNKGVRLDLRDGRHVLVGSRVPELLLAALRLPGDAKVA